MEEEGETKLCSNCKRDIAAKTFELHEVHCRRHIILCQVCGDTVPVKEQDEHFQEYHALEACDVCGEQVQRDKLEEHKDQLCPERRVECKYCELDIKSRDYEQHVDNCGSRTDYCDRCMQRVMLKDMEEHRAFKCGRANSSDEEVDPTLENLFPDTHGHGHFDVGLPLGAQDLLYGTVRYDDEYEGEYLEDPVNDFHGNGLPGPDREFEPQDVPGGNSSVLVDQSWLETVSEACGSDFDHVLAQNMYYENMRQVSVRDEYHGIENGVVQEGVSANRQREEQYHQRQNDADLARQLQSQFDNRQLEEQRDAELAQQLQREDPPPPYQPPPPPYQAPPTDPAPSVEEDAELAQRLQEEELKRHQRNEGGGVPGPDNEEVYQRESGERVPDNERYGDRVRDSPSFNPRSSYSTPRDTYPEPPTSYSSPYDPHSSPYDPHSSPYDPHSSNPAFYSTTAYRDNEQPRPKTPPPKKMGSKRRTPYTNSGDPSYTDDHESEESEGKIPCQFCNHLFPFEAIMLHQQHCTADYSTTACSSCGRVHPRATSSSSDHYGDQRRVDVAALLKESSDSEEESSGTSAACQYCGRSFPRTCIMPHQALCERNPDKYLKDAYRSPRTNPPRPLMGGTGGGVIKSALPSKFEAEIPCEFCGRKLKSTVIHAHQPVCHQNPSYKVQQSEGFVRTGESQRSVAAAEAALPGGVERGPCEFCAQLLPLTELVKHQATCQFLDKTKSAFPLSASPTYHTATSPTYHTATSPTHYTATSPTHYTATGRTVVSPSHTATSFADPTVVPAAKQNKPRPAVLKPATFSLSPQLATATVAQARLSPRFESSTVPSTALATTAISLGDPTLYPHTEHRAGQASTSLTYSYQATSSPRVVETRKRLSPSSDFSPANSGSKMPRLGSSEAHGRSAIGQSQSSASYRYATTGSSSPTSTESVFSHLSSSSNRHHTSITLAPLTQPYGTLPSSAQPYSTPLTLPPPAQPYSTPLTLPPPAQPYSSPLTQPLSPSLASSITKSFVPTGQQQTSSDSRLPHFSSEADLNAILNCPRPALVGISTMGLARSSLPSTPSPTTASETYPSIPTGPLNSLAFSAPGTRGLLQPSSSGNQLYSKADQYSKDGSKMKKGSEKELSSLLKINHNPAQLSNGPYENAPASVSTSVTDYLPRAAPKPALVDHPSSYTTTTPYGGGLVNGSVPLPTTPLSTAAIARDRHMPFSAAVSHDPTASTVERVQLQGKGSGSAFQGRRTLEPAPEGLAVQLANLKLHQADRKGPSAGKTGNHGVKQSKPDAIPKPNPIPKPRSRLPRASGIRNPKNGKQPSSDSSVHISREIPKPKPRTSTTNPAKSSKPVSTTNPAKSSKPVSTANPPTNTRSTGHGPAVVDGKSITCTTPPRNTTAGGRRSITTTPRTSTAVVSGKSVTGSPTSAHWKGSNVLPRTTTTTPLSKGSNVSPRTTTTTPLSKTTQSRTAGSSLRNTNARTRQSGKQPTGTHQTWKN